MDRTFLPNSTWDNPKAVPSYGSPLRTGSDWRTPPSGLRTNGDWRTPGLVVPKARTGAFEPTVPNPLPATGIPAVPKMAAQIDKDLRAAIAQAEADTAVPTDAQRESGNYKKGKFTWNGLGITIETAKGQARTGVNKATGQPWSVTLKNSYGYIRGTDSAEPGDQMDVFIGPNPESEVVYVVDQNKADGKTFDEHKVCVGCASAAQAKALYHDNYSAGWKGFRNITALTVPQFKNWLKSGDMDKPLCGQEFAKFHKRAADTGFDWSALGQKVREQMPGFHGWDTLAGATAAGIPAYLLSATSNSKRTRNNRWRNTLLAAGAGGLAANVIGDRARRYITNIPGAFGYETSSMTGPAMRAGLRGVWDGAVLDKPITPAAGEQAFNAEHPDQWLPEALPRRELLRRALGVHAPTSKDFFISTGQAAHNGVAHDRLEFHPRMFKAPNSNVLNAEGEKLFEQSVQPEGWAAMNNILQGGDDAADRVHFDGNSIGSSIFGNLPVTNIGDARRMRDVWDFDWSDKDRAAFQQIAGAAWKRPSSLLEPFSNAEAKDDLLRTAGDKVVKTTDILKSLLARKVLNNVLVKSAPVFEQNFVRGFDPEYPEDSGNLRLFRSPTIAPPNDAAIGKGIGIGAGILGSGALLDWLLRKNPPPRKLKRRPVPSHLPR